MNIVENISIIVFVTLSGIFNYWIINNNIGITFSLISVLLLAKFVGNQTEEISEVVGEILGGITNATFGNVFELLFSLIALFKNREKYDEILLNLLIGGVVSNILLVLGSSIYLGGLYNDNQIMKNIEIHSTNARILLVSSILITIPSLYKEIKCYKKDIVYIISPIDNEFECNTRNIDIIIAITLFSTFVGLNVYQLKNKKNEYNLGEEQEKSIKMNILFLLIGCGIVGFISDNLINDIENIKSNISSLIFSFVISGFIGSFPEHYTAITASIQNKIDESISISLTSSIQLLMFIPSILVFLGFIRNREFTLVMPWYLLIPMNITTLCSYLFLHKKKMIWIEGLFMMFVYLTIIVTICNW
uniref:Sodium/calcium exchanger membrane region domain-containing protein n=1 Tax=viral metagenome TaxID=1070528 RepID=A0A6C0H4S4_9ZZZZ